SLARKRQDRETLAKAIQSVGGMLERDRGDSQRLQGQLDAGQGDVQEDVERLEEELSLEKALHQRAWLRVQGDKLLADKLTELQTEQQDRREAPLTEAIRRYLATGFGAASSVSLEQQKGGARSLALVDRSAAGLGAFRFSELSHGARELVGLAVRLAMAEVMAKEQPDGCMPLVLDDAVTNVDSERLPRVGYMIGQATQSGVQVVLATCETKRTSVFLAEHVHLLERVDHRSVGASDTGDAPVLRQDAGDDAGAFVAALVASGGQASTRALREQLGWDTGRFDAVRDALDAQGAIRRPEGSRSVELTDARRASAD
ncbi:MAG: hypothetical protein O3C51_14830, partial [Planctomycetota bacterium]|nr:hypothetical protein [Planctomycetota bacterium]